MNTYLLDIDGVLDGPVELPEIPGLGTQLPSNAVELAVVLPEPDAGHVWALIEGEPKQLADHRGKVYRTDTGAVEQHALLGALPPSLTTIPKPSPGHQWQDGAWAEDPAYVHSAKVAEINGSCEMAISSGFWSSALGSPHQYSSQIDDQLNLTGTILRRRDMPYACRDEQNVKAFRLHTVDQLFQVGDDFTLYKLQLLQRANELKQLLDQALAAGDLTTIQAVTWTDPQ